MRISDTLRSLVKSLADLIGKVVDIGGVMPPHALKIIHQQNSQDILKLFIYFAQIKLIYYCFAGSGGYYGCKCII